MATRKPASSFGDIYIIYDRSISTSDKNKLFGFEFCYKNMKDRKTHISFNGVSNIYYLTIKQS